jgi:uncharacterized protein YoxC
MEAIEKLTDEISLICIDTRNILDKINEIADEVILKNIQN